MRRNGDRGLVGGDREILDRGYGFHRTGDRWLPDRWLGMPGQIVTPPGGGGLVDGDPVATWGDSSGLVNNATAAGAARPTFKTGGPNSKPFVRYTGAQAMNLAAAMSAYKPWTAFIVAKPVTGADFNTICNANGATNALWFRSDGYGIVNEPDQGSYLAPTGSFGAFHVYTTFPDPSAAQTDYWRMDGAQVTMVQWGVLGGAVFDTLGRGQGDIAEAIFFKRALTATEMANVEKYLGTKYGISVAGGIAVQPNAIAGLTGWWQADSMTPAPAFDPMQVPGILAWWKAETLQPLADTAPITSWTDSSGKGRHATSIASPGNAPYFTNNVGGSGKPGVVYDGNPRWLAFSPKIQANGVPVSVVAVMWVSGHLMGLTSVAGYNACCMPRIYTGDGHLLNQVGGQMWYSNATWIAGAWAVYTCTSKPSSFTNGSGGDAIGSLLAAAPGDLDAMGSEVPSGQLGIGYHGEIIAYDHVLTDTERVSLERYLATKYGVVVGLLRREIKREVRREVIKRGLVIGTGGLPEPPEK